MEYPYKKWCDYPIHLTFRVDHRREGFSWALGRDGWDLYDAREFCNGFARLLPSTWYVDHVRLMADDHPLGAPIRTIVVVCLHRPEDVSRFWLLAADFVERNGLEYLDYWSTDVDRA